jgi:hypothetical protein
LLQHYDVERIYLLIRSKKNEDPVARLKNMLSDEVKKETLKSRDHFTNFVFHSSSTSFTRNARRGSTKFC